MSVGLTGEYALVVKTTRLPTAGITRIPILNTIRAVMAIMIN